jgi:hypothetical protein
MSWRLLPVMNGPGRSGHVQVHHREGERSSPDSGDLAAIIDGQPPGEAHRTDTDANGTLTRQRTYQLIRQPGPITDRTFQIIFPGPGAQAYCFTFGETG